VFRTSYTEREPSDLVGRVAPRRGWDFSRMSATRAAVPWEYPDVVRRYLRPDSRVLDIGTGGGEQLIALASCFDRGIGVDIDPEMVQVASTGAEAVANLRFQVSTEGLEAVDGLFDVILDRHAPVDLRAVRAHLTGRGHVVTQQVGERNTSTIRAALGLSTPVPPDLAGQARRAGLEVVEAGEYDVEYVVHDVESLVFWLSALDLLHADVPGATAVSSSDLFNRVLAGAVDNRGFVTNEHRYLLVATTGDGHPVPIGTSARVRIGGATMCR